ncbi:serine/threonine-protein kinase TTK/MPS1 [Nematocida sp. AWRm80]|nr:serine/threonine-protein kinase TTK/MPS1 [Nematocida sp. AWRm80]
MERLFRIEDILRYIEEQKRDSASPTRLLSMYYEATQKNLEVSPSTLTLWLGYISLLEQNGYGHTEIREVYKMLKSKYWRYSAFWMEWFNYENRMPLEQSKKARVLEMASEILQYKECDEKQAILNWIDQRNITLIRTNEYSTRLFYPETPRSILDQNTQTQKVNSQIDNQANKYSEHHTKRLFPQTDTINHNDSMYRHSTTIEYSRGTKSMAEDPIQDTSYNALTGMHWREYRRTEEENYIHSEYNEETKPPRDTRDTRDTREIANINDTKDQNDVRNIRRPRTNTSHIAEIDSRLCLQPLSEMEESPGKGGLGQITITNSVFDAPPENLEQRDQTTQEHTLPDNTLYGMHTQPYKHPPVPQSGSAHKKITLNGKRLRILRTIGKGGSAKVYQVLSDKNEVFALKKVRINQQSEDSEVYKSHVNEIQLLKRLKNRHEIITLKDSYVNKDRIAILMEYGDIDLHRFLELERHTIPGGYRKSQENCTMLSLWEQMLRAVKCIHEHRIVHRDLKPGNFLFVNGRLKLIDFGISKEIRNDTTNIIREKQIGTINYMSPEAIIEGKTKMGRSSDIWSLGCILYEMYFGESPFMRHKNLVQRMQKLLDPEYQIFYPPEEPNDNGYQQAVREIKMCLVREPKRRATIDTLLAHGICSRKPYPTHMHPPGTTTFTKEELKEFVTKIMDLKHTLPTEESKAKVIEKIVSLHTETNTPAP